MTLLLPAGLACSAIAVPIVLLYVLKLRRQVQEVSSTVLWEQLLDDVQANAPWQRLRPSMLLLLQLLGLAVLVLAFAQPAATHSQSYAGDLVLIVDQSYGMQAHDPAACACPSRFVAALRRAHSLATDVGSGNLVSVIGMGAEPRLAIAESDDQAAVGRAIDGLQPTLSSPNFLAALSFAASLARTGGSARAVVLTSRNSGIASLPMSVPFPVEIVRIGGGLRDLGITAFSAARGETHTQALVRVSNFGSLPARSDLDLFVDGQLEDVRPLVVAPGRQQNQYWTNLPLSGQRLQARLTLADDVAQDKQSWAVVGSAGTHNVLLVGANDFFLQTALADDPTVRLSTLPPAAYRASLTRGFDLVVFDGALPSSLPSTSVLLIGPPPGQAGPLRFGGQVATGALSREPGAIAGPPAALLQYLDLSDVHVALARRVSLPGWLLPVVTSGATPLVAAGDQGGRRAAVLTFALQQSDWPLRISFPILLQNLLHYLVPGMGADAGNLTAGQTVRLFPPPGTRQIEVTRPDGTTETVQPPQFGALGGPLFLVRDSSQPGVYTARASGSGPATPATDSFAVNFFPARAAPVTGPATVWLGGSRPRAGHAVSVPLSFAWLFSLAALALLGAEWWVAFRR